jgi:hypothetical protein
VKQNVSRVVKVFILPRKYSYILFNLLERRLNMINPLIYEGKIVNIFAPFGGRRLDVLYVTEVTGKNLNILYGTSRLSGIETAYDLDDGIKVEIVS